MSVYILKNKANIYDIKQNYLNVINTNRFGFKILKEFQIFHSPFHCGFAVNRLCFVYITIHNKICLTAVQRMTAV